MATEEKTGSEGDAPIPERFVPVEARGELTEAEHLARYWWAAQLAQGRTVLDAGCGVAYGSRLLADAGATRVVGVDRAAAVIEAARETVPGNVELTVGDVTALPFDDDAFGLVVCFEVIEHLDDQPRALDELARVLAPDGVLILSSPNRDVYVPGNPHHTHEYTPGELEAELRTRFAHVELRRQHNWVTSLVADDRMFAAAELAPLDVRFAKVEGQPPGAETYTVAFAGDAPLPQMPAVAVATGDTEVRRWLEIYDEQQAILERQHAYFDEVETELGQLAEARRELERSERELARLPGLELDVKGLRREVDAARLDHAKAVRWAEEASERAREQEIRAYEAEQRLERATRVIEQMKASPSWRLTAPLRRLKRLLG